MLGGGLPGLWTDKDVSGGGIQDTELTRRTKTYISATRVPQAPRTHLGGEWGSAGGVGLNS